EHATEAGLRSLAELDLDDSYRRRRHDPDELVEVEPAVPVAAAEVRGPAPEDQVATVAVVRGEGARAGVVHVPGTLRTRVQRLDRRCRQGAETHRRDVDDRGGPERVSPSAGPAEDLRRRQDDVVRVAHRGGGS